MTNDHIDPGQPPVRRIARPAALLVAGILAGGIGAATVTASAQTPTPSPSTSTTPPSTTPVVPKESGSDMPAGDETALSGTNAEKASAAALKAVPGGTIERLETDSGPAEYEAHMRKADGSRVTVLMDAQFNVTSVEEGRRGGRGGKNCPDGPDESNDDAPATLSTNA
jgi:hypothetical protein